MTPACILIVAVLHCIYPASAPPAAAIASAAILRLSPGVSNHSAVLSDDVWLRDSGIFATAPSVSTPYGATPDLTARPLSYDSGRTYGAPDSYGVPYYGFPFYVPIIIVERPAPPASPPAVQPSFPPTIIHGVSAGAAPRPRP